MMKLFWIRVALSPVSNWKPLREPCADKQIRQTCGEMERGREGEGDRKSLSPAASRAGLRAANTCPAGFQRSEE